MHTVLIILITLVIGVGGGYFFSNIAKPGFDANTEIDLEESAYDVGNAKLPTESVRVSSCIPRMGYHWTRLEDLGRGPTYNVWNDKIIGIEYHLFLDQPEKLTREDVMGHLGDLSLFGAKVNHFSFNPVPEGHGGVPTPHWDVHFYLISPEEVNAITCIDAPAPATPSATESH